MCGIIGILGKSDVAPSIVEGLKRLEYRGYDSAGVATLENGAIDRRRAAGKLSALTALLEKSPLAGFAGIGHTRWATHGAPTDENAHPHQTSRIALVHNGIIENFAELRAELIDLGYEFQSETDTEVCAQLITRYMERENLSPKDAFEKALSRLRGAFALAAIVSGEDDLLLAARLGSPLAIGRGEGEMFVGSDAFALAPFTNRITYLEEGDWAVISRAGAQIFNREGKRANRAEIVSNASSAMVDKAGHRHFMAKEIHEQPEVIGHTLSRYVDPVAKRIALASKDFDFAS
ncbi:MAG: glutamine--fructose-6-phosphate aminotransferase, partial [Marinicaulis sp.]|nr:glutamine--fructose-6-phosphate aminotransferase [Marinicaulis sp.]